MTGGNNFVRDRLYEIAKFLNLWGYTVVPDPDDETWAEAVRTAPLTGRIQMRGERSAGEISISFTITEVWEPGDFGQDAAVVREGSSLTTYHFHGQCSAGGIRWCLFPAGHPDVPYHVHPWGDPPGAPIPSEPISAKRALGEFEAELALRVFGEAE